MAKKKHPTSRRRPRDVQEDPDDVFVARVFEFSTWAQQHSQTLILAAVAVVLVVAGGIYYANYRATLDEQAVLQLEQIHQKVALGETDAAKADLTQFLEAFTGTSAGLEGRLLLGQLYLTTDQPEQAIVVLNEAGRSLSEPLGPQIGSLLARAYEAMGRAEDAERQFMAVARAADMGFLKREALADAARVRMANGDPEGAAELYREILDDLEPNDPERGLFEMRLAEADYEARS